MEVQGNLRVQFSESVSTEMLALLHDSRLESEICREVKDLLAAAGASELTAVHDLTPPEIATDRYGFARDFKILLRPDADDDRAMRVLTSSPLVASARPLLLRRKM